VSTREFFHGDNCDDAIELLRGILHVMKGRDNEEWWQVERNLDEIEEDIKTFLARLT
jgi:Na+/phosphate symporter